MDFLGPYILPALQIIWINILLSGDNAVVIALACRNLPEDKRRLGVLAGSGAAVALRVVFTLVASSVLTLPWVKLVGGILLLWVAIKLLTDDELDEGDVAPAHSLSKAIRTIAIADVVMSLDNVLAIAAVAQGSIGLIVFGLIVSVPLVVAGSQIILATLHRAPWIVWAGAALLGWVAGEIIAEDKGLLDHGIQSPHYDLPLPWGSLHLGLLSALGAALVLIVGVILKRKRAPVAA